MSALALCTTETQAELQAQSGSYTCTYLLLTLGGPTCVPVGVLLPRGHGWFGLLCGQVQQEGCQVFC